MTNLGELERMAGKYAQLKKSGNDAELAQLAAGIVEAISIPSFSFPLKKEAVSNKGTTTFVYEDNAAFPALYDFLGELLHSKVPLEVGDAKFGPGEIIVNKEERDQADKTLDMCVRQLQELVHAKESEIFSKHAGAS